MSIQITVLVVHPEHSVVTSLLDILSPEFEFSIQDYAPTLGSAFRKLVERDYTLCLIYGLLTEGLDVFLSDMKKAGKDETCSFVQFWDELPGQPQTDGEAGFSAIIALDRPQACKAGVMRALEAEMRRRTICEAAIDVTEAVNVLLKNVDDSVDAAQLGKNTAHDRLISGFVETKANFDPSIIDGYVDALIEKAGKPSPGQNLTIPGEIVERNLPNLTKAGYAGTSVRVLRSLRRRYGGSEKVEAAPAETERDPDEEE